MKFGKRLMREGALHPEVSFVAYKVLKKQINSILVGCATLSPAQLSDRRRQFDLQVRREVLNKVLVCCGVLTSQIEAQCASLEEKLRECLRRDLASSTSRHGGRVASDAPVVRSTVHGEDKVDVAHPEDDGSERASAIEAELDQLGLKLAFLFEYCMLNCTGLRKIVKKFDKRVVAGSRVRVDVAKPPAAVALLENKAQLRSIAEEGLLSPGDGVKIPSRSHLARSTENGQQRSNPHADLSDEDDGRTEDVDVDHEKTSTAPGVVDERPGAFDHGLSREWAENIALVWKFTPWDRLVEDVARLHDWFRKHKRLTEQRQKHSQAATARVAKEGAAASTSKKSSSFLGLFPGAQAAGLGGGARLGGAEGTGTLFSNDDGPPRRSTASFSSFGSLQGLLSGSGKASHSGSPGSTPLVASSPAGSLSKSSSIGSADLETPLLANFASPASASGPLQPVQMPSFPPSPHPQPASGTASVVRQEKEIMGSGPILQGRVWKLPAELQIQLKLRLLKHFQMHRSRSVSELDMILPPRGPTPREDNGHQCDGCKLSLRCHQVVRDHGGGRGGRRAAAALKNVEKGGEHERAKSHQRESSQKRICAQIKAHFQSPDVRGGESASSRVPNHDVPESTLRLPNPRAQAGAQHTTDHARTTSPAPATSASRTSLHLLRASDFQATHAAGARRQQTTKRKTGLFVNDTRVATVEADAAALLLRGELDVDEWLSAKVLLARLTGTGDELTHAAEGERLREFQEAIKGSISLFGAIKLGGLSTTVSGDQMQVDFLRTHFTLADANDSSSCPGNRTEHLDARFQYVTVEEQAQYQLQAVRTTDEVEARGDAQQRPLSRESTDDEILTGEKRDKNEIDGGAAAARKASTSRAGAANPHERGATRTHTLHNVNKNKNFVQESLELPFVFVRIGDATGSHTNASSSSPCAAVLEELAQWLTQNGEELHNFHLRRHAAIEFAKLKHCTPAIEHGSGLELVPFSLHRDDQGGAPSSSSYTSVHGSFLGRYTDELLRRCGVPGSASPPRSDSKEFFSLPGRVLFPPGSPRPDQSEFPKKPSELLRDDVDVRGNKNERTAALLDDEGKTETTASFPPVSDNQVEPLRPPALAVTAEQTGNGEKDSMKMHPPEDEASIIQVDPKTYLSNERTYFRYLHMALLLSVTSVVLLRFPGTFLVQTTSTRACAFVLAGLAFFVVVWSYWLFEKRLLLLAAGAAPGERPNHRWYVAHYHKCGRDHAGGPEVIAATLLAGFSACWLVHLFL